MPNKLKSVEIERLKLLTHGRQQLLNDGWIPKKPFYLIFEKELIKLASASTPRKFIKIDSFGSF